MSKVWKWENVRMTRRKTDRGTNKDSQGETETHINPVKSHIGRETCRQKDRQTVRQSKVMKSKEGRQGKD